MVLTFRSVLVAATTASAGLIHLAAGPAHTASPGWYWGGFVVVGLLQLGAATLAVTRGPLAPTLAINVIALGVWAASQTVGLPAGVGAHAIGLADGIAVTLQLASLLAWATTRQTPLATRPQVVAVAPLVLLAFALAGVSSTDLQAHQHAHDSADRHEHDTSDTADHDDGRFGRVEHPTGGGDLDGERHDHGAVHPGGHHDGDEGKHRH